MTAREKILAELREHGPASGPQLAQRLQLWPDAIRKALSRARESGEVVQRQGLWHVADTKANAHDFGMDGAAVVVELISRAIDEIQSLRAKLQACEERTSQHSKANQNLQSKVVELQELLAQDTRRRY